MMDSWLNDGDALDTGTDDLLAGVSDGVATIVLSRPDRRNALSGEMLAALARVLERLETADDVGALVITGSGPAFCAGGDVKGFSERGGEGGTSGQVDPAGVAAQRESQRATVGRLHAFAGLGLALAADLRIGVPRTVITTAFARVGLSGDYGTAWLLRQLVGPSRAAELMFLSDRVDADTCLRLGLLNWIVPEAELRQRTAELASRLAHGPRLALAGMKHNLLLAGQAGLDEAMDVEVALHKECGVTDDHREAVAAFVEKREARFGRTP
jgi:2-(1,2-epoxy-1,2-dihydrophenyl)acetyl-CoA isomerase